MVDPAAQLEINPVPTVNIFYFYKWKIPKKLRNKRSEKKKQGKNIRKLKHIMILHVDISLQVIIDVMSVRSVNLIL